MTPKVLFINPPSVPYNSLIKKLADEHTPLTQIISMPMGILYLSAVLKRDIPNIEIKVIDLAKAINWFEKDSDRKPIDWDDFILKTLKNEIEADFTPHFVGISTLFSTAHKSSIHIAEAAKKRWPGAPIIFGGMHATNAVDALLAEASIDYICRGEGESVISQFLDHILLKKNAEDIEGIIGTQKLHSKTLDSAPLINNLDEIPFPAWECIDMPSYVFAQSSRLRKIDTIEQDGEATIVTTRGCPFHCTFCASWTVHGRKMRYRSTENVVEELRILKNRYNATSVTPEDDLFTVKKDRIIDLCNTIYAEFSGTLHFQFPNGLSVATLDEDVIGALIKMGMTIANIAIESGSPYVQRKIIEKNCNLERAKNVVQHCRDTGVITRTYFILGFPGETREHMQETVDFILQLPSDWSVISQAGPLIGTKMYEQLLERGDIDASFNWDDSFFFDRNYDTPEISAEELKDLVYTTNVRVNFFENYNFKIGEYERSIKLWKDILNAYPHHLIAQYCIGLAYRKMGKKEKAIQALNVCNTMLQGESSEMAQLHYAQFKQYMPLIEVSSPIKLPHPSIKQAPRPGMPHEARRYI